jgi:glycosyltransferase involved in cell wall biosynthesis
MSAAPAVATQRPDLSFIIPCYNEEEALPGTVLKLMRAFEREEIRLELVCVDNGSRDGTARVIDELAARFPGQILHGTVVKNIGMGNGVLTGIPLATAPLVGMIPADGQVDAADVVRLYEAVMEAGGDVLGKVRRRFRMDGMQRKIVSVFYNVFVRTLWPGIGSWDINGCPRLMPREALMGMELNSTNWLIDPEILIKAYYMKLRVVEFNVFARARGRGISHVGTSTMWEFFTYLLGFRFGGRLRDWRQRHPTGGVAPAEIATHAHSTTA